jgi:hypothetical protein
VKSIEETVRARLASDVDPAFFRALSIAIAWAYQDLFERIDENDYLDVGRKKQDFGWQRSSAVECAIIRVCKDHGVPFEWKRLEYNGQKKLMVLCGRVIFIHEAMQLGVKGPYVADYKRSLAGTHNVTRQLELDLGDIPGKINDWSGEVLATLLHGHAGALFTKEQRALGVLRVGVADGSYDSWVVNQDITEFAVEGRGASIIGTRDADAVAQQDRTKVVLRQQAKRKDKNR